MLPSSTNAPAVSPNPTLGSPLRAFRYFVHHAENLWKYTQSALNWSFSTTTLFSHPKNLYSNLVSSTSGNPKRLWQTVNKLLHSKSSSPLPSPNLADSIAVPLGSQRDLWFCSLMSHEWRETCHPTDSRSQSHTAQAISELSAGGSFSQTCRLTVQKHYQP